ncbi:MULTISPECIES: hypothetical protein [unclassified Streptomyces]|uniref:hypothetical protein n=1 Tax=unclassified Streptomyces TaxID=2593676 RepID=UPI003647937F
MFFTVTTMGREESAYRHPGTYLSRGRHGCRLLAVQRLLRAFRDHGGEGASGGYGC